MLDGHRFDRWLERWPGTVPQGLGAYRIVYAAAVLLMAHPAHRWVSDLPDAWWAPPPGPMALLATPPPEAVVVAGHLVFGVLVGLLLVGYRTVVVSIALSVTWFALNGVAYSFGKIDHGSFVVAIVPLAGAAAGWGRSYSVDATRHAQAGRRPGPTRGWPVTAFAVLVAAAMATAAVPKVNGGWLSPETSAVRGHVLHNHLVEGRDVLLAPVAADLALGPAWPAVDVLVVAAELGLVFVILHLVAFRAGLVALVGLHAGVGLAMNISFTNNLWAYAFFAPAVWWLATAHRLRISRRLPRVAVPVGVAAGAAVSLLVVVTDRRVLPAALDVAGVPHPGLTLGTALWGLAMALSLWWVLCRPGTRRAVASGPASPTPPDSSEPTPSAPAPPEPARRQPR